LVGGARPAIRRYAAMINVYHLASAAPIAMFGMFALWPHRNDIGSSALRLWPRP
jgi:hypothetical protein